MKHQTISLASELGLTYVGKGIDIISWQMGQVPDSKPMIIATEDNTTRTPIKKLQKSKTYRKSYTSFLHSYAASLGISGSYGGFSGSLKTKFSGTDTQSIETSLAGFNAVYTGDVLNLGQDPKQLRPLLTDAFETAIESGDIDALFTTYGTHLVTEVYVGAMLEYFCASLKTESLSERDFSVDAEAKYETVMYEIGAQASISDKTKEEAKHAEGRNELTVYGGTPETAGALSGCSAKSFENWLATVEANPAFLKFGENTLIPIWELASTQARRDEILAAFKKRLALNPVILTISKTSPVASHPSARISLADLGEGIDPGSYKMLSGGARDNWHGDGNLLTASYPDSATSWNAHGKDHIDSDPASITVYLTAIYDPMNIWDVEFAQALGQKEEHPVASVSLSDPTTHKLVGGGAVVSYGGAGCLMTASYPTLNDQQMLSGWQARAKDHIDYDSGEITVYAIGLSSLLPDVTVETRLYSAENYEPEHHPNISVKVDSGQMTGGGALDDWKGDGNLLYASFPSGDKEWTAQGKDHKISDPAPITAYAISLSTS